MVNDNNNRGPKALGQCDSLGEYCGPHAASEVFLILLPNYIHIYAIMM